MKKKKPRDLNRGVSFAVILAKREFNCKIPCRAGNDIWLAATGTLRVQ